jgi:hypothetical protein
MAERTFERCPRYPPTKGILMYIGLGTIVLIIVIIAVVMMLRRG